jgi:hypothetical protein
MRILVKFIFGMKFSRQVEKCRTERPMSKRRCKFKLYKLILFLKFFYL